MFFKTKKLTHKHVCFSLLIALLLQLILPCSVAAGTITIPKGDQTIAEAELFVYNSMIHSLNESLRITNIRSINDFAGNKFTLIETSPSGYFIFHNASGIFVEYSDSGTSPYLEASSSAQLIYGGPTFYYIIENGSYVHTMLNETISLSRTSEYAKACNSRVKELMDSKDKNISTFISSHDSAVVDSTIATRYERNSAGYTYVPNGYQFFAEDNANTFGYVDGGYCGYIAANMILRYWDDQGELTLASNYTSSSGLAAARLTNYLIAIGEDDLGFSGGTVPWQIADVLDAFCSQYRITADYGYSPLATGIKSEIDSGFPVILFGQLAPAPSSSVSMHAVTVYGYYEDSSGFVYEIAHFGWNSNTAHTYVYGNYGGSTWFDPTV